MTRRRLLLRCLRRLGCALGLGSALLVWPPGASAGELTLSGGFDISTGDYGLEESTEIYFLPFSVKYATWPWTFKVSSAYLRVNGPTSATGNTGVLGETAASSSSSGIGDVHAAATYSTNLQWQGNNYLDFTAKAKLPSADASRGLGTGELDFAFELDWLRSHPPWTPFASVGYRLIGKSSRFRLSNGWLASAGVDYKFNPQWSGGAIVGYREPISRGADDSFDLTPYLTWRQAVATPYSVTVYSGIGLSEGSPNLSVGMQIGYRWTVR